MSTEDYEAGRKAGEESGRLHAVENIQINHHQRISNLEKIAWITFGAIGFMNFFPIIKSMTL